MPEARRAFTFSLNGVTRSFMYLINATKTAAGCNSAAGCANLTAASPNVRGGAVESHSFKHLELEILQRFFV
jgi:hypothetical protein